MRGNLQTLVLLAVALRWSPLLFLSFLSSTTSLAQAFVHPFLLPARGGDPSSFRDSKHDRIRMPSPFHSHLSSEASSSEASSSEFEEPQRSSRTGHYTTNATCAAETTSRSSAATTTTVAAATTTTTSFWNKDALYLERYKRRKLVRSETITRERERRPPNPHLEPMQVVQELLEGLGNPHDPLPYFGVQILWESSTLAWQETLGRSIGRNQNIQQSLDHHPHPSTFSPVQQQQQQQQQQQSMMTIVPSLYRALARPHQQFAILFSSSSYWVEFPTDALEWDDHECWIECRLRSPNDDQLLCVLGWTLQKNVADGQQDNDSNIKDNHQDAAACWYLQALDWQDFRDAYRPGIGREEWERICG
jgi:hypothetical protein